MIIKRGRSHMGGQVNREDSMFKTKQVIALEKDWEHVTRWACKIKKIIRVSKGLL